MNERIRVTIPQSLSKHLTYLMNYYDIQNETKLVQHLLTERYMELKENTTLTTDLDGLDIEL